MNKLNILKHMISSNKKTFHYTFKMLISLQDQIEKMVIPCLDQYQMPNAEKKGIYDWLQNCKESRKSYQRMIEDGFESLESYF